MKKLLVTITTANEKEKIYQESFECNNSVDASRIMLTYQCKKGYEIISFIVDYVEVLV